jgi:ABC-2 type transport system ATP-binding protein
MPSAAISIRGLHKEYGAMTAVSDVDLEIEAGEVFALLGPNGAGKTTTVEILEGYRQRTSGEVSVLGVDPEIGGEIWRARIGIVLQTGTVFDELTVEELVRHSAGFYSDPLDPDRVIEMVGLDEKRTARCARLSGGQRRRVDLALGVVGNPELLFLDEPTTGFDPAARRQAWEVIRELTSFGATVLLTTHYLDEAEALADRVGVIANGRILEVATPRTLGGRAEALARVSFHRQGPLRDRELPVPTASRDGSDGVVEFETMTPTAVVAALTAWVQAAGLEEVPELSVTRPSLEEIYLRMVQDVPAGGGDKA